MTVYQLENSLTHEELYKWSLYLAEETPDVNELQMAILSNMVASYMSKKKKSYKDFLIRKEVVAEVEDKKISNAAILAVFGNLGAR